jgi:hypothetical protein
MTLVTMNTRSYIANNGNDLSKPDISFSFRPVFSLMIMNSKILTSADQIQVFFRCYDHIITDKSAMITTCHIDSR